MGETTVEERRVTVRNRMGLHARPAAEFVKLAAKYEAEIELVKDDLRVNGKSIMGVLMLAAEEGTEMMIRGEGVDAVAAVDALEALVENGFNEV